MRHAFSSTILGDKDDTSGRTKQFNDGHVPDLVEINGGPTGEDVINEIKVYTDLKKTNTKGCATRAGASFRCDGHRFAFGNSEDKARVECLGRKQRGRVGDPPFNHNTGKGYIEGAKGYYHDALVNKKNKVNVLLHNTFGVWRLQPARGVEDPPHGQDRQGRHGPDPLCGPSPAVLRHTPHPAHRHRHHQERRLRDQRTGATPQDRALRPPPR